MQLTSPKKFKPRNKRNNTKKKNCFLAIFSVFSGWFFLNPSIASIPVNSLQYQLCIFVIALFLVGCAHDTRHRIIISAADQKMLLLEDEKPVATYRVSTSKYGLGDAFGSYATPTGRLVVYKKIGEGVPCGMVFKDRKPTGEILCPNAPGRDPIVTRILWIKGTELQNWNAYGRYIYIHGTPEEKNLGQAKSYGCVRMSSADVMQLYERVGKGATVEIVEGSLNAAN